jgi:putative Mg2+ transporter-C (MgtC) family protein
MDTLRQEFFPDFVDAAQVIRVLVRLTAATILGGIVGFEREAEHKSAGMRTHMLVALGAALFTLVPIERRMESADISRVMQGIAAGIGFLGAGMIFKQTEQKQVHGLTTAANIWATAAIGIAVGAGMMGLALVAVGLALFILFFLHRAEHWLKHRHRAPVTPSQPEKKV